MHGCLIGVVWYLDPSVWLAVLEAAIGLGFVIFVHELGHFLVAKLCGVKVEKFCLGFDIAGLKLAQFQWGETRYIIGIMPLGGYVKMLGQEDNPARLREEIERAKATAGDAQSAESAPAQVAAAESARALYDPRSYLAKSVPRRIAIISAGVAMNMIFAFLLAVVAFGFGVRQIACSVGQLIAGGGAWQAGMQPGDVVTEIAGRNIRTFRDMQEAIMLGDAGEGVPVVVQRPGVKQPVTLTVKAHRMGGRNGIGIASSAEPTLSTHKDSLVVVPGSPAAAADPPFRLGDRIVRLDDQAVASYAEIESYLALHAENPIQVTVARAPKKGTTQADGVKPAADAGTDAAKRETIRVAPSPMLQFGLVMDIAPISAIRKDSPADRAGVKPGDILRTVDGRPAGDPMTLPDRLRAMVGREVALGLERDGKPLEVRVTVGPADAYAASSIPKSPVAVGELGIAYPVKNSVAAVVAGGPAAKAGIQPGDVLTGVAILPPSKQAIHDLQEKFNQPNLKQAEDTITLGDDDLNWPFLMYVIQPDAVLPGTTVKLQWKRGGESKSAVLEPVPATDWFNPSRGWVFESKTVLQTADSFGEAVRDGMRETVNATLMVYGTIHRIGTGDVSPRNLGGPVSIFQVLMHEAAQGIGNLLLFLTLLSANLAVLNFLPIPVLDGGHLVLLLYEGISGKPANERVQEVLTYIGLILILTLMVFALGLDFGLISRQVK